MEIFLWHAIFKFRFILGGGILQDKAHKALVSIQIQIRIEPYHTKQKPLSHFMVWEQWASSCSCVSVSTSAQRTRTRLENLKTLLDLHLVTLNLKLFLQDKESCLTLKVPQPPPSVYSYKYIDGRLETHPGEPCTQYDRDKTTKTMTERENDPLEKKNRKHDAKQPQRPNEQRHKYIHREMWSVLKDTLWWRNTNTKTHKRWNGTKDDGRSVFGPSALVQCGRLAPVGVMVLGLFLDQCVSLPFCFVYFCYYALFTDCSTHNKHI